MVNVNVEEIKKYNSALKAQKERANKLEAERDYKKSELERNCKELSAELGIQVTPENIKQIYVEYVAKIENAVRTGSEILTRIQSEENKISEETTIEELPTVDEIDLGDLGDLGDIPLFGNMGNVGTDGFMKL